MVKIRCCALGRTEIFLDSNEKYFKNYLINCINNFFEQENNNKNENDINYYDNHCHEEYLIDPDYSSVTYSDNDSDSNSDNEICDDEIKYSIEINSNFKKNMVKNFSNVKEIYYNIYNKDNNITDLSEFVKLQSIHYMIDENFVLNFKFPQNLVKINFMKCNFNNELLNLPDNLKELYLGDKFDQLVNNLPSDLKILKFSNYSVFNQTLDNLPLGLNILFLGINYNNKLDHLPENLKILKFFSQSKFNLPLDNLPNGLEELHLGNDYNNNLDCLPKGLEYLYFYLDSHFNLPINNLPNNLKILHLGLNFSQSVDNLPDSLEVLKVDSDYFIINKVPTSLVKLYININMFDKINLLNDFSINYMIITNYYTKNHSDINFQNIKIPKSINKIKFRNCNSLYSKIFDYANENHHLIEKKYDTILLNIKNK